MSRQDFRFIRRYGENFDHAQDVIAVPVGPDHFVFADGQVGNQHAQGGQSFTADVPSLGDTTVSLHSPLDGDAFIFAPSATLGLDANAVRFVAANTLVMVGDDCGTEVFPAADKAPWERVHNAPVEYGDVQVSVSTTSVESGHRASPGDDTVHLVPPTVGDFFPLSTEAAGPVSEFVNYAPKPVATIAQLANYLVNGFWQANGEIAHRWGTTTITYNIEGLNAAEKFLAQSALNAWREVANLNFVQTAGAANITYTHNGSMQAYEYDYYSASGLVSSAYVNISADWIATDGGAYDGKTGIDSYGYQTYIHETGHALGLGHQGNYNGSSTYASGAIYANDTWQYSIMSYFGQHNYGGSSYRYVITPQMADIYAVQSVYGAAATRAGDTVYGFNTNAGAAYDFAAYAQATALTIYDSGGRDTIDASGYSNTQTIDLRAGNFSSIGGLVTNIGIMSGTIIEAAIGGNGNDTLIGNDAANTLRGNAGVDTMTGGNGADVFVFTAGSTGVTVGQRDRITDFVHGTDKIDLSGYDARPATSGIVDLFDFIGTSAFNGIAGALNYLYDSVRGVTVVQADTNGDRNSDFAIDLTGNLTFSYDDFIGTYLPTLVIETSGATDLTQIGSRYYLYANSGSGPSLKMNGADVVAGQFIGWDLIGAELISGGYQVAWKVTGVDQYAIWGADGSGNYNAQILGLVSGNSYVLQTLEVGFQQDLNGDGTIGSVMTATAVESSGLIRLTEAGSHYYLLSNGLGPSLKMNGADVVAGQFSGWDLIGAELISGGYQVAWKATGVDQYAIWGTDGSGNYNSQILGIVSGGSYALQALEVGFQQDLNADSVIGFPTVAVEANGATQLAQVGDSLFLYNNGGAGPSLKLNGTTVLANQFGGGWTAIAAEAIAGGYEVAWKVAGGDQYAVWGTDSNGNYNSQILGIVSGSSYALQALEVGFQQDLNADGTIGSVSAANVLETSGSVRLTEVGSHYYFLSGGSGPSLKLNGAEVIAGQFSGWEPIGAESISGGYQIAWKDTGADQYAVWGTDANGNYNAQVVGQVSGNNAQLKAIEVGFQQDLNGDTVIGQPAVTVEANGATRLSQVGDNYFMYTNAGTGPSLKVNGADVIVGQFSGWDLIGAEFVSGGYHVAWKTTGVDQYAVWGTDANGNYNSQVLGIVSGNNAQLKALEVTFQQDLNGDSTISAQLLAAVTVDGTQTPPMQDDVSALQHQHHDYLIT